MYDDYIFLFRYYYIINIFVVHLYYFYADEYRHCS